MQLNLFVSRKCALLALLLFVSACAQPLSQETTDELDALATSAASVVGLPAELQTAALTEARRNQALCRYLSGGGYQLGVDIAPVAISNLAAEQSKAGKALKSYVTALIDATRGASLADLEKAQADFSGAAGSFFEAAGFSSGSGELFDAALSLASRVGESQRQKRIRTIMREAIDPLFILEALLRRDAARTISETESAVSKWSSSARCVLTNSSRSSNAIEIFDTYNERSTVFQRQLKSVRGAPDAVEKLRVSHILAVTNPESFESAIQEAVEVLQDLDALVAAIRE